MATRELKMVIGADTSRLRKDFDRASSQTKKFTKDTEGLAGVLNSKLGRAIGAIGIGVFAAKLGQAAAESVRLASNLSESMSKADVVFGQSAINVKNWARTAVEAFGQTEGQALEAAGTFGNLLVSFGETETAAASMSMELVELASDLASLNNTSIGDALTALRSGLSGEMEPLKRYGVTLSDVRLRQEALRQDIELTTGALDPLTKAQLSYSLILQDTTTAQGDFARTQGGLANTTRTLAAAVEQAKTKIGEGLVFAIEDATAAIGGPKGLASRIEKAGEEIGTIIEGTVAWTTSLNKLAASEDDAADSASNLKIETISLWEAFLAGGDPLVGIGTVLGTLAHRNGRVQQETRWNAEAQAALEAGYRSNTAAARRMADANLEVAQTAAAAAKGTVEAAVATGQVPWKALQSQRFDVKEMLENIGKAGDTAARGVGAAARGIEEVGKESEKAEQRLDRFHTRVRNELSKASEELQRQTGLWEGLRDAVDGAFSTTLGSAFSDYTDQLADLADLDEKIADAITRGDSEGAAKAAAEKAALGTAQHWVDAWKAGLQAQADLKSDLAKVMQDLVTNNPELAVGAEMLTREILSLDPEQARAAMNDLIEKGAIPGLAEKLQSTSILSAQASRSIADAFYLPGVQAAQTTLNAISEQFTAKAERLYKIGKKAGKDIGNGIRDEVAKAVREALAAASSATSGARMQVSSSGATGRSSSTQPITINVNAGIGDPVAIGRSVEQVLNVRASRLGL